MNESKRVVVGFLAMVAALLVMLTVVAVFWLRGPVSVPPDDAEVLPNDEAETAWLNVKDATYVGNQQCVQCHAEEHKSYLATAHSKALGRIQPQQEPADAEFVHAASNRKYRVYRGDEGELRHSESMLNESGEVIAEQDFSLDWLIGSGFHSRSYLVEQEGFLLESPVTWYQQSQQWRMSPGYDKKAHWGFERPIERGCIYCHVGETDPVRDGYHKLKIKQAAISCERCHGPGSLHVAERQKDRKFSEIDRTIVNPAHLSRERREDICAQCHLRGAATVMVQGKDLTDYRPGLRLDKFRVDFRLLSDQASMTVVGHVEQMRLSKCYTRSSKMTCTTCHDPHDDDKAPIRFQQACLQCHEDEACGAPLAKRKKQAKNRCVTCHMPQSPTDIPHIAFTHHRIGVHPKANTNANSADTNSANANSAEAVKAASLPQLAAPAKVKELTPWRDLSHLDRWQRDRLRALAYFEYSNSLINRSEAKQYERIAQEGLEALVDQAEPDSEIDAALARIYWKDNAETAQHAALHAISDPGISDSTRVNMLYLLAETALRLGKPEDTVEVIDDLIRLRRHSEDYLLKGVALLDLKRTDEALSAFQKAAQINPFRDDIQLGLADAYAALGKSELAAKHREQAAELKKAADR